ncbi:MAG: hypothetical protein ACYSW4_04025 [Planctomycetota bacterium]|jgi:DNA-directed RNA polymerase subunit RPC12/RpoP
MIRFECEKCGQKIRTSDRYAGKKAKCPKCKSPLIVPTVKTPASQEVQRPLAKPALKKSVSDYTPEELANMSNAEVARELLSSKASDDSEHVPAKRKRHFLIPDYDEVTLLAMSVMFVLLYITSRTMRADLHKLLSSMSGEGRGRSILGVALLGVFFFAGICFSVFHAFSTREKNIGEKAAMLLFAVLVSAGTGIYAGMHMLTTRAGWLIVFPIWNIINGILLLIMFRFSIVNVDCISDRDATGVQIVLGLIAAAIIFICCQYFFKLHWAITYSICICYIVSFDRAVQSVFGQS